MRLPCATAVVLLSVSASPAQIPAASPRFEVASLKPNPGCENRPSPPRNFSPSPGRLELPCTSLGELIRYAFGMFADGANVVLDPLHIEGGPRWMDSEFYSVNAKSDGFARTETLAGPMLQTLLAERFQLKTHREPREVPTYAMIVNKGGLKVERLPEGACIPVDLSHPPSPVAPGEPPVNLCGIVVPGTTEKGTLTMELRGTTMLQLAQRLSPRVHATVIDKTDVAGRFTFRLEYAPDPPAHSPDPSSSVEAPLATNSPTILEALQEQVGVKLVPGKGHVDYLIIDHAERPEGN